ncbi:MAG: hypothetical protein HN704_01790 [Bacteroidetes bacterium]|nr:hypothetical protein [Bacteroidota bacterium]MBT6686792.1 hypothetical protein [Bacteroidota bacterium]MBT7142371.1 hypothetical protein [Bacteroidota bacterium]MBT7490318.1 hypothetical protein [Bacteroidota bacterium]
MDKAFKKMVGYALIVLVFLITIISILSIWDIINIDIDLWKVLTSLFIVFIATTIVLFIFSVLLKDSNNSNKQVE